MFGTERNLPIKEACGGTQSQIELNLHQLFIQ